MATPTPKTESATSQVEQSTGLETGTQETAEVDTGHGEAEGLAVLGVDAPFLIAQVVNFFVLLFLLRWLLYRPVLEMLNKRRSTIEGALAHADAAAREAASAEQRTASMLAEARAEAKKIVDDAKAQAEGMANEIRTKAIEDTERLVATTRAQLEQEKAAIVASAERELADLIVRATEQVVGSTKVAVDPSDVAKALASAKKAA